MGINKMFWKVDDILQCKCPLFTNIAKKSGIVDYHWGRDMNLNKLQLTKSDYFPQKYSKRPTEMVKGQDSKVRNY